MTLLYTDPLCIVTGVLKGFDQLLNLVLDEVEETLQFGEYSVRHLNDIICSYQF